MTMDAKANSTRETTDLESPTVSNNYISENHEENMQNSDNTLLDQIRSLNGFNSTEKSYILPVLLPLGTKESISSTKKSRKQPRTDTYNMIPPDEDDVCAPILLACLFCHPLDCVLATVRGLSQCLCSFLFCCPPAAVQNYLNVAQRCNVCRGHELCCCQHGSNICDQCLQTTECLDIAMEISRMLNH
ncbi:uncharacterized protein LOC144202801 [Stigmatopora nigra]